MAPTLWAISDLHTGHTGNKPVTESLYPSTPDDWLIVAGDVAERTDDIRWSLDLLRRRFAKVIWVPGNHEAVDHRQGPGAGVRPRPLRLPGQHVRRDGCDNSGTPFPIWTEQGGPATIVPMFLLYDYTFLPAGARTKAEGLAIAKENNVVATDEFLLSSEPYATRDAWCRDRLSYTRGRLEELDWMNPTVLVNHFPLRREPCDVLFFPEFSLWCGTVETADWHTRYNAVCSVYGHLHIPRTTWYDGVRFEEVSVGYPRVAAPQALSLDAPDPAGPAVRTGLPQRVRRPLHDHRGDAGAVGEVPGTAAQPTPMSELMRAVLPDVSELVYAELYDDPPELSPLPEEEPLIAKSVAKRRNEFVTVRHCARWRWNNSACRRPRSSRGQG